MVKSLVSALVAASIGFTVAAYAQSNSSETTKAPVVVEQSQAKSGAVKTDSVSLDGAKATSQAAPHDAHKVGSVTKTEGTTPGSDVHKTSDKAKAPKPIEQGTQAGETQKNGELIKTSTTVKASAPSAPLVKSN